MQEKGARASRVIGLSLRREVHRAGRLIETVGEVAGIPDYSDDCEITAQFRYGAEVLADGVFASEKLARECLIDNRYPLRIRRILLQDGSAADDGSGNDFKIARRYPIPRRIVVISRPRGGMAVHPNARGPTSAGRRVQAQSHGGYAGNPDNGIVDAAVEQRQLRGPIAGKPRIDVGHQTTVLRESEILIF